MVVLELVEISQGREGAVLEDNVPFMRAKGGATCGRSVEAQRQADSWRSSTTRNIQARPSRKPLRPAQRKHSDEQRPYAMCRNKRGSFTDEGNRKSHQEQCLVR